MSEFKDIVQTGDWANEKHVPLITIEGAIVKGEPINVRVATGREIPHPNTTAHHIDWLEAYFLPDKEKFPYLLGRFEFSAHGASVKGADTSTVYTEPELTFSFRTEKEGRIIALQSCNIHGLWEATKKIVF